MSTVISSALRSQLAAVGWGLLALMLVVSPGCQQSPGAANQAAAKPNVTVATPVRMPIVEWDEYIGRLEAVDSVNVRARVSGYLSRTCFDEGQMVEAGELLAVIDQRPFQAEVSRNQALVEAAKAELKQAQSTAAQTLSEKQRVDIRRGLADKHVVRSRTLRQGNATTAEDLEVREAELAEAESEVVVAAAKIDSANSAVAAAQSAVGVAQANLDLAELNLKYTEIRAPISGRISQRYITEGNFVSGGSDDSTLLTTIVSVDPIHCYFDADEQAHLKYTKLAREGIRPSSRDVRNPVYMALANERDGFPHKGHMDFVDNRLDRDTATMRARAIFPNKDQDLTPGLFTRVRIPGSPRYDGVLVPDRTIGTDQAEKFVFVVDAENKVQRKMVTLGPMSHGLRVIRSGLAGDERVILSGIQRIRPGDEVTALVGNIDVGTESLPDDYSPVPQSEWLTPPRATAANTESPASATTAAQPSVIQPASNEVRQP
jgi:multidrug efflux system membrane fusion protein